MHCYCDSSRCEWTLKLVFLPQSKCTFCCLTLYTGDGFTELLSQDLISSSALLLSENDQMSMELDSGCGTENNTESLVLQTTDGENPREETPSTSLPTHPRQPRFPPTANGNQQDRALLSHTRFLQNLCGLRKLDARGLCPDGHGHGGSLVWDSVCQLLGSLVPASGDDPCHLRQPLLLQAAQVACQAVDEWQAHSKPPQGFLAQAEDCLKEITHHLLNNSQLNRVGRVHVEPECLNAKLHACSMFR